MGCLNSAPVQGYRGSRRPTTARETAPLETFHRPQTPEDVFNAVTEGVRILYVPSNMTPILCLTKTAIPIITTLLHLEDSTPTEIRLPIIAGSVFGKGLVICLCQVDFWSRVAMQRGDTRRLLSNVMRLLAGTDTASVAIFGFTTEASDSLSDQISSLGFQCKEISSAREVGDAKVIVIPSDLRVSDEEETSIIGKFVHDGGGLLVTYLHVEGQQCEHSTNDLLYVFGLAYTMCLLNANLESAGSTAVPATYSCVESANLDSMINDFEKTLKQPLESINTTVLDDCVTSLRYYIMVCGPAQNADMLRIVKMCWEFLDNTNYASDEGICWEMNQAIVLVLLQDLYSRLPIEEIPGIPEHEKFPGKTGETVNLSNFDMSLQIRTDEWISTGLWLPASVSGVVFATGDVSDIEIQIGCHKESLLSAKTPWPRWPSIVSVSALASEDEITVGSPFGGIVYVTRDTEGAMNGPERSVQFSFKNFARYPRYVHDKPKIWEETKDLDVPWAEIDVGSVIFSLPSADAREISDFARIKHVYDIIVAQILRYTSTEFARPYRVVYDVDLADPLPPAIYPVVSQLSDVEGTLIDISAPNTHLFNLAVLITISSIKENTFDPLFTHLLAELAAAVAVREVFPDFDPLTFEGLTLSKGFVQFWDIQNSAGKTVIPNTLAIFQDPNYEASEVPDDMWIPFVKELCRNGRYNFTRVLENVRPLPISVSWSANELATFIGHTLD